MFKNITFSFMKINTMHALELSVAFDRTKNYTGARFRLNFPLMESTSVNLTLPLLPFLHISLKNCGMAGMKGKLGSATGRNT